MRKNHIFLSLFVLIGCVISTISAQTPAAPAVKIIQGDITSISSNKIVLQTKYGSMYVGLTD